jgi:hypothetical protein
MSYAEGVMEMMYKSLEATARVWNDRPNVLAKVKSWTGSVITLSVSIFTHFLQESDFIKNGLSNPMSFDCRISLQERPTGPDQSVQTGQLSL